MAAVDTLPPIQQQEVSVVAAGIMERTEKIPVVIKGSVDKGYKSFRDGTRKLQLEMERKREIAEQNTILMRKMQEINATKGGGISNLHSSVQGNLASQNEKAMLRKRQREAKKIGEENQAILVRLLPKGLTREQFFLLQLQEQLRQLQLLERISAFPDKWTEERKKVQEKLEVTKNRMKQL
ncbi:hypothetical protein HDU93_002637 [Gonapodya sp. JEL0774]|nr:hypothetical protein HDU93_002637 [Gonapodya sp. JEL0774]